MTLEEKADALFSEPTYVERGNLPFNINADYLKSNSYYFRECDRELYVSLFPMLPLLEKTVALEDADYILYSHQYARIEDMSPFVLKQLREIDQLRRPGAEIIVVGKASNAEQLLAGSIKNITFWPSHYTELVGKKFGTNITDEYFVYDEDYGILNIWPVNGCLRKCKFCRRTYMDIPFESLSLGYIKARLDWYKENCPEKLCIIRLRAENLAEYGLDIYQRQALPDLIDLVSSYDEVKEIRIGLTICEITDDILDAMRRSGKISYVEMNPEAGSNRLLQVIGKEHTRERTIYIATKLREVYPDIFLNCVAMVGLPTETLSDVYALADLCIQMGVNTITLNRYGATPRSPLNSLPQLSPQLQEYHLRLAVRLIKSKKLAIEGDLMSIIYERKLKRNSRKAAWYKEFAKRRWEEYCLLTWDAREDLYTPFLGKFVEYDSTVIDTFGLRTIYLRAKAESQANQN